MRVNLTIIERVMFEGKKHEVKRAANQMRQQGYEEKDCIFCKEDGTFFMVGERRLSKNQWRMQ